jgi:hypothetical protein
MEPLIFLKNYTEFPPRYDVEMISLKFIDHNDNMKKLQESIDICRNGQYLNHSYKRDMVFEAHFTLFRGTWPLTIEMTMDGPQLTIEVELVFDQLVPLSQQEHDKYFLHELRKKKLEKL